MTRWEQNWALEVLAAFAPSAPASATDAAGCALAPRPGEVDYVSAMRRLLRGSTPLAALGLRVALWMVVLAPLWSLGRFVTFGALAATERSALLARLLRHGSFAVRELALLLKFAAAVALLGTPSVRERSGYDNVQAPAALAAVSGEPARLHRLPVLNQARRAPAPPEQAVS